MYEEFIGVLMTRPPAYSPNEHAFWDDPHISQHMLQAHLNLEADGASRPYAFMRESAKWIAGIHRGGDLLDLGCGPGLYAELFDGEGFAVTGIDLSKRSIHHAAASAKEKGKDIRYHQKNYLSIDYESAFDVVTLIYCDFGALEPFARARLLKKIYRALRPGGVFVTDVWAEKRFERFEEKQTVKEERSGFWSPGPYVCLTRNIRYEPSLMLDAYHVVTAGALRSYYLWDQAFTEEGLTRELHKAGFSGVSYYADVCGRSRGTEDETLCAVARKERGLSVEKGAEERRGSAMQGAHQAAMHMGAPASDKAPVYLSQLRWEALLL